VDALELLRADDAFVADTSAWWRALALPEILGQLVQDAIRGDGMVMMPNVRMEPRLSRHQQRVRIA